MIKTMLRQYFAQLSLFEGLDQDQIELLSPYFEDMWFSAGTVIFEQGELANCLYILLEGEVEVRYKPYDGPPLSVARITPGGVFGWSAALGRNEYTSGAQAGRDSQVVRVRNENLHKLCDTHPETGGVLLDHLAGVIAERLRNTHTSILAMLNQGLDTGGNCSKKEGES
jgi:CRP/FNR family cyclic AMP-dependent transcriptional regulator